MSNDPYKYKSDNPKSFEALIMCQIYLILKFHYNKIISMDKCSKRMMFVIFIPSMYMKIKILHDFFKCI